MLINLTKQTEKKSVETVGPHTTDISLEKKFGFIDAEKLVLYLLYYKKKFALEYIKKSKENDLVMIGEDISIETKGAKRFYVCKRDYIYYSLQVKSMCIYESIENNSHVKLHIDVDLKEEHIIKDRQTELNDYIDRIYVLTSNVVFNKYKLEKIRCIVLKSRNEEGKISAHMIFPDIVFENIYCIKYMFSEVDNSSLIENKILDPSVYRVGLFRFLWAKKIGKNNTLDFYKGINYELPTDKKELFDDCYICLINKKVPILKHEFLERLKYEKKNKITVTNKNFMSINNDEPNWINLYSVKELKQLLDILNIKRGDGYTSWSMIGMALFNCNNSLECLELWDEWSKLNPDKYEKNACRMKWIDYRKKTIIDVGVGYLKNCAKKDDPEKFSKLKAFNKIQKPLFKTQKINKRFIINKDDKKDDIKKIIKNWVISAIQKILCFISAYGTGKTVTVKYIIDIFKPERILWITHRQTLTFDLFGALKDYRFVNYLDGDFFEPRLLCQIESLYKIKYNSDEDLVYDLIVFDESESLLNHYLSSTLKEPRTTFDLMQTIMKNAKKIIALDGDFSDRSYIFLKDIDPNLQIIENTYKTVSKHYFFTNDNNKFNNFIDNDIKNNKNICIVSMSANVATTYYEKYKDQKTIMHCSTSDDSLKKELRNVNDFWSKYKIIIYSPSVGEGVDFNIEHIDKMYVILSDKSTSPRGLLQMCGRIRKLKDNNINVYLNGFPYTEYSCLYTIDDIGDYYTELRKNYNIKKTNLYDIINNYNELENLNKNKSTFVSCLIDLLKKKGHTYSFDQTIFKKQTSENKYTKEAILNAPNLDEKEYQTILSRQKKNEATYDDKIAIIKYDYKKIWNVEEVDENFMDDAFRKTHIFRNLKSIIENFNKKDEDEINNELVNIEEYTNLMKCDENNEYLNVADTKYKEKMEIIIDLIKSLGYDSLTKEKLIMKDDFEKNKENVKNNKLFKNQDYSLPLFNMKKKKIVSNREFLGFINSILSNYGLKINLKRINEKNKKNKKIYYFIKIIDNYINYI